jgi:hypothetical protein
MPADRRLYKIAYLKRAKNFNLPAPGADALVVDMLPRQRRLIDRKRRFGQRGRGPFFVRHESPTPIAPLFKNALLFVRLNQTDPATLYFGEMKSPTRSGLGLHWGS